MFKERGYYCRTFLLSTHSSVLDRLVFGHEFILKIEIIWIKRTIFAKLFGVKAPLSSIIISFNFKSLKTQVLLNFIVQRSHLKNAD